MEKIWLKHYPKGVEQEIDPEKYKSIVDLIQQSVASYGDSPCMTNMGVTFTYSEIDRYSDYFASYLINECNLKKGDRIAIQMPNVLQYPIAMIGAIKAGIIVVNTNPLYTDREMEHQFMDADVKMVVILENFAHLLEKILPHTNIKHIVITSVGDLFPFPKNKIVNLAIKYVKRMVPSYNLPHAVSFNTALMKGRDKSFDVAETNIDDIAFLQYTGGTTGVAKGAMLTHRNVLSNMLQALEWFKPKLVKGEEIVLTPLPLYHIFSLTVNCLTFMSYGAHIVLVTNPRDIPDLIKTIKKHRPTVMSGVNTLFNAMLNCPDMNADAMKSLKMSVAGAMALQEAVAKKWLDVTKSPVIEGYGLTEASPIVSCNPIDGNDRAGTIGIPVPSTEIKLIGEDGNEVGPGEPGELCVRGPQIMKGYWNRPEETAKTISDGWLLTGDMACVDEDGYFKIVDRKKDMILISGFNVYPNEVEDVVASHPAVLEVAAIGVPDEHSGEVVKIFVVKKSEVSKEDIVEFSRKKLTGYKVPKHIEFRDELPKSNVGKILRKDLRNEEIKRIEAQ